MKNKQITIEIKPEDIRALIATSLSCIFARQRELHDKFINQIDEAVREGTTEGVLKGLSYIIESFTKMANEIDNVTPLILGLETTEEETTEEEADSKKKKSSQE